MAIKVRALKPFFGVYGKVKVGDEIEVSEAHAKRYQDRGLAVPAAYGKAARAPMNKMEGSPANKADDRPLGGSPDGGPTGAATRSSSSPEDQPRKTRRSTRSTDERD